jgi:hypothetical protein
MSSVVSRTCKPKPADRFHMNCLGNVNARTDSPSIHPCPASGRLTSFLPASALELHEALRPPSAKDARYIRPTSATRTTCVHPHLARSQLLSPLSQRGHPAENKALRGGDWGDGRFHDVRTASTDPLRTRRLLSPAAASASLDLTVFEKVERGHLLPAVHERSRL